MHVEITSACASNWTILISHMNSTREASIQHLSFFITLTSLIENNVPRVTVKNNANKPKWWTSELQRLKNRRDKLFKQKPKGVMTDEYSGSKWVQRPTGALAQWIHWTSSDEYKIKSGRILEVCNNQQWLNRGFMSVFHHLNTSTNNSTFPQRSLWKWLFFWTWWWCVDSNTNSVCQCWN